MSFKAKNDSGEFTLAWNGKYSEATIEPQAANKLLEYQKGSRGRPENCRDINVTGSGFSLTMRSSSKLKESRRASNLCLSPRHGGRCNQEECASFHNELAIKSHAWQRAGQENLGS